MERILTDICEELNNWFTPDRSNRYSGTYTITGGAIVLPDNVTLQPGQRMRIVGSVFNDGVHVYPAYDLIDETFDGSVWAMRVPVSVLGVAAELQAVADGTSAGSGSSPYASESLTAGGYSYTRATNADGTPLDSYGAAWASAMRKLGRRWRKMP